MAREIVRRLASNRTHVAEVGEATSATMFGAEYQRPVADVRALCGVLCKGHESVIMREGSEVKCHACRYLGDGRESVIV